MKRLLLATLLAVAVVTVTSCDPTPGCFERVARNGQIIVECR